MPIGVGGVLGVASAIKAASTAAIVGTAIGAATGGALLGYGGGNAGYYLSPFGIFNTVQKATQSFSKAFQEDVKNEPKQQHRKNVPL